jgi:hypothetical protein
MEQFAIANEDGGRLTMEDGASVISDNYNIQLQTTAENDDIEKEALNFLDFSERDPFSEKGTF